MKETNKNKDSKKIYADSRFAKLLGDPRFKKHSQEHKKIKIDKRFQSIFHDSKFQVCYPSDKYGRRTSDAKRIIKNTNTQLKSYYELSSSGEDEDKQEIEDKFIELSIDKFGNSLFDSMSSLSENVIGRLKNLGVDYARGEAALLTDSSSDEEENAQTDELILDNAWGDLDQCAPRTDESTHRLAACNMDWDRIRAVDIFVLCHSFLSMGTAIRHVTVYLSEFGKQRLQEEEISGPKELVENDVETSFGVMAEENYVEEAEYHREKLRQYQLNRLKYYYAVIECDSVSTADKLYAECDGLEYESTANKLDFRFIPNEVSFKNDEVRDICTSLPNIRKYKPRIFTTKALQQGKVELTWDENDLDRKELNEKLMSGNINEVSEVDLRKFVAYSSESEDSQQEDSVNFETETKSTPIHKYRALLNGITSQKEEKQNQEYEREMTWDICVKNKVEHQKTMSHKTNKNPFDKMITKINEKREARKKRIKEQSSESSDDIHSDIDISDPYFTEEFENGEYCKTNSRSSKKKSILKTTANDSLSHNRTELALLLDNSDNDVEKHFNFGKIQDIEKQGKMRRFKNKHRKVDSDKTKMQVDFKMEMNDIRFKSVYSSPDFNIDPTNSSYRKTEAMDNLIHEKLKRRQELSESTNHTALNSSTNTSLGYLVKHLKRKLK